MWLGDCRRYPAYGALYTILEVLALPAVPLTMTAGLLFGVGPGAAVVSVSATIAATISFLIARYAGAHPALQHAFWDTESPVRHGKCAREIWCARAARPDVAFWLFLQLRGGPRLCIA